MDNTQVRVALIVALLIGGILGWITAPYAWDGHGWSDTRTGQGLTDRH